jgi:hypothetical protein
MRKKAFDVFISHASEDKESFVHGLANELQRRGLAVWYDTFELNVGDSLTQKIEGGLAESRFGIIVYSPIFFKKKWSKAELNGLFAREMAGKTRILPIRHNLDVAQLRKRYPIQSDKFSLSSTMSLDDICNALIRVIRPELLESKTLRAKAFDASEAFLQTIKKQHPEWEFSLQICSNPNGGVQKKIEYRPVTAAAIANNQFDVEFADEGVRKIQDFIRTGRPQTWAFGEFTNIRSPFPFFPDIGAGSLLTVGPPENTEKRPVRVQCGNGIFQLMNMKIIRSGTEELEFEIAADGVPLKMEIVFPLTETTSFDAHLSWTIEGFRASQCRALMDFVTAAEDGESITVTDLQGDSPPIVFPVSKNNRTSHYFDDGFRRLVTLCTQIESEFQVKINMRTKLSEEDQQSLGILDSLINKKELSADISASWNLSKGANNTLDSFVCRAIEGQFSIFSPVEGYIGHMDLFGTRIPTPLWGILARCNIDLSEEERKGYCSAKNGYQQRTVVNNDGRFRYDWAANHKKSDAIS